MSRLSFDAVDALIYDPVSGNRTATRAALYALGFRRTETVATLDAFVESVQKSPPDIAVCEAQGAVEELCGIIQSLRQGGAGHNPFIVIIVTAWEKNTGLINRVLSSGADDLLLRPFSTGLLGQRIETHIERRKSFVITSDYVGPDRRKEGSSRDSSAPLFAPPNSLKLKAKDKLSPDAVAKLMDTELKSACEKLHGEKLRRDAFQACILWRLMQETLPSREVPPELDRLSGLAASIGRRSESEVPAALAWCEQMVAACEGLKLGVDRNASMHLLGHAALSLHQVFHPEVSSADQLAEIDATVALIRARNQAPAIAV